MYKFVEAFKIDAYNAFLTVQRLLPSPLFIASVSPLITDDDVDSLVQQKSISLFT